MIFNQAEPPTEAPQNLPDVLRTNKTNYNDDQLLLFRVMLMVNLIVHVIILLASLVSMCKLHYRASQVTWPVSQRKGEGLQACYRDQIKNIVMIAFYALFVCALCFQIYLSLLDKWINFLLGMLFSNVRYFLLYYVMFKFAINEYIQAAGAVFMAKIIAKQSSQELKAKIGARWNLFWRRRDYALTYWAIGSAAWLVLICATNVTVICLHNDKQLYEAGQGDEYDGDDLLANIQFVVGNEVVYLVGFSALLIVKLVVVTMFCVSVCRYFQAKTIISDSLKAEADSNLVPNYEQPKMREKLPCLFFCILEVVGSLMLLKCYLATAFDIIMLQFTTADEYIVMSLLYASILFKMLLIMWHYYCVAKDQVRLAQAKEEVIDLRSSSQIAGFHEHSFVCIDEQEEGFIAENMERAIENSKLARKEAIRTTETQTNNNSYSMQFDQSSQSEANFLQVLSSHQNRATHGTSHSKSNSNYNSSIGQSFSLNYTHSIQSNQQAQALTLASEIGVRNFQDFTLNMHLAPRRFWVFRRGKEREARNTQHPSSDLHEREDALTPREQRENSIVKSKTQVAKKSSPVLD